MTATATAAAPKAKPVVTGTATIAMPVIERRNGAESMYPFNTLEVGQAFGVKGKDKRGMGSPVSNANRKNKTEMTDPSTGAKSTVQSKHFVAVDVNADLTKQIKGTPLEGSTVLVFRDK